MIDDDGSRAKAVPSGRFARGSQFGRLAAGIAGGVVSEGARRLAAGQQPKISDLLLTPANVGKLANRLSHLRGAAMKLGQMMSMDAGDFLPAELTTILARLRDNAHYMPPQQLQRVWRSNGARIGADASHGSSRGHSPPHRSARFTAQLRMTGACWPSRFNIRASGTASTPTWTTSRPLLRLSGLLPRELDILPLLAEAKRQLAKEADYRREGAQMTRFGRLLSGKPDFVIPELDVEFTTECVLAMTFVPGRPIEELSSMPQDTRDLAMGNLIRLVLAELFTFKVMQTDPNFANYRVQPDTGRIVLLDFGAVRDVTEATAEAYRRLLRAGLDEDRSALIEAAVAAGFFSRAVVDLYPERVGSMMDIILERLSRPGRSTLAIAASSKACVSMGWQSLPTGPLGTCHPRISSSLNGRSAELPCSRRTLRPR